MEQAAPQAASATNREAEATTTDAAATIGAENLQELSDPEFFTRRRRVREQLEALPERHADRAALARLYDAMTDEFTRRAARAWRAS